MDYSSLNWNSLGKNQLNRHNQWSVEADTNQVNPNPAPANPQRFD